MSARLSRLLAVLDLYPATPDADAIAASLGCSRGTVLRDLRDLRDAGAPLPLPARVPADLMPTVRPGRAA